MAGTNVFSKVASYGKMTVYKWSWVGDASTGAILSRNSDIEIHGYITKFETNPGSPAPTANYSLTLTDQEGCDVLGGMAANRSATVSEQGIPLVGGAYSPSRVDGILTLAGTGQSVNSAVGDFFISVEGD